MGLTYQFRTEETLSLTELRRVISRAKTAFQGFFGFSQEIKQTVAFSYDDCLPVIGELTGVAFGDITIRGYLASPESPFSTIKAMLYQGVATTARQALFGFEVGYLERNPVGYHPDFLGVAAYRDTCYFTYRAHGSPAGFDVRYRKQFYQRLIKIAQLPINLSARQDFFNLYHADRAAELWLSQTDGINRENPGAFRVEMPDASLLELVTRMEESILPALTTSGYLKPAWYVTTAMPGRMINQDPPGKSVYDNVAAARYPAQRLSVELQLAITDLFGIEALRAFCSPLDHIATFFGQIRLPEENYAEIEIITTAGGHGLRITSRWPVRAEEMGHRLGLTLVSQPDTPGR